MDLDPAAWRDERDLAVLLPASTALNVRDVRVLVEMDLGASAEDNPRRRQPAIWNPSK